MPIILQLYYARCFTYLLCPGITSAGLVLLMYFCVALQFDTSQSTTVRELHDDQEMPVFTYDQHMFFKTTLVNIAYSHLVGQVWKLLQHCDYEQLLEQCREINASEEHGIKLFCDNQLKRYDNTLSLMQGLCCYATWSDHSILRELCSCSTEATKLLDEFDSRLDYLEPVSSYPIPQLSSDMIPFATSVHTVLAIRCNQELYNCTLQFVYDMRSLVVEKCSITLHCLQLLAIRANPTIIYWTIPYCVVEIIRNALSLYSEYLYSKGVVEVFAYPDPLLTSSDGISMLSLAFNGKVWLSVCNVSDHKRIQQTNCKQKNNRYLCF